MAQLLQAFDAKQFDPTQSSGSLPIGKHPVVAISSEIKPTSNNDGGYLQYDLQIIDGPNKGQTGPYRLNLYNQSQKAVEIAHRQMSALCHVTGVFNVQESAQLHNIPFIVEVGLQKDPNPEKYTEIKKVFDITGNEPGKAGQGAPAQQPAQQTGFAQQQPAQQAAPAQGAPAWGQGAQQLQQQPAAASAPAWGQQQQPAQQAAQQPAQAGGWQQGATAGAAPWGQK